ncbi:MAG: hypothetical protein RIS70_2720 [Planctomycetota bacterium]
MNPRTRLLGMVGLAVVLLYCGDYFYGQWFEEPSRDLESQLSRVERQIRETDNAKVAATKKAKPLASYAARALPYDPELARSLYQDWLLQLVETHRLESASVDAGSPNRLEVKSRGQKKRKLVGHSFSMTLRAKTTLPQLVNLLHDFRHVGHLHKIRSLSLVPLGTGSELDVNMSIEVLSMQHADREDTLSTWVRDDEQADPLKVYSDLLRRNLFARGLPQALAQIRLQAITTDKSGRKEAWLGTATKSQTQIVAQGESLDLQTHKVVVEEIESERVRLNVDESRYWLALGQRLRDVVEPNNAVAAHSNATTTPATELKDSDESPVNPNPIDAPKP